MGGLVMTDPMNMLLGDDFHVTGGRLRSLLWLELNV